MDWNTYDATAATAYLDKLHDARSGLIRAMEAYYDIGGYDALHSALNAEAARLWQAIEAGESIEKAYWIWRTNTPRNWQMSDTHHEIIGCIQRVGA